MRMGAQKAAAEQHVSALDVFLDNLGLGATTAGKCPYLPAREATHRSFAIDRLHPEVYHELMDRGYRRSGKVFYANCCRACQECRPIRVPSAAFRLSRSQKRVRRRNADLRVELGRPLCTSAKWDLFRFYCFYQHSRMMLSTYGEFKSFLYESAVQTIELCYFLGAELVGVSIADASRRSLSSVYFYWNPRYAWRSLGTYSVLWEIDFCRRNDIPYYYLGFYVHGARTMEYKGLFRPCEILAPDGRWVRVENGTTPELNICPIRNVAPDAQSTPVFAGNGLREA